LNGASLEDWTGWPPEKRTTVQLGEKVEHWGRIFENIPQGLKPKS
jgi:hypothetical protein